MKIEIKPASNFAGSVFLPGDKSISHRAVLFGALAEGETVVRNLTNGADVQSSISCMSELGAVIRQDGDRVRIRGRGRMLVNPSRDLDCGNSGTTMRMLMGILAGQPFSARMIGDASLSRRPMTRITVPLCEMGANVELTDEKYAPVTVKGRYPLRSIEYALPMASAQVKSAVLLAGIFANGETAVTGEILSRDHTERLLPHFGIELTITAERISILGDQKFKPAEFDIPGDPSSAAFWLAASQIVPGAEIELQNVLLNPTRIGFLEALKRMGAELEVQITNELPEPVGIVRAKQRPLMGIKIDKSEVPSLIDELPMLAVLATYATGPTEVSGAEELRVKETDRIEATAINLRAMGAAVETRPDGFRIEGSQPLHGAEIEPFHDHRIAMAFAIGALGASESITIKDAECVGVSYRQFFQEIERLRRG